MCNIFEQHNTIKSLTMHTFLVPKKTNNETISKKKEETSNFEPANRPEISFSFFIFCVNQRHISVTPLTFHLVESVFFRLS